MKPYLVTQSSYTPTTTLFLESFPKISSSVEYYNFQVKPYWPILPKAKQTIYTERQYRTYANKFVGLDTSLFDDDRYVIFTDTSDVLFQDNVPDDLVEDIYITSENIIHDGEPNGGSFWRQQVQPDSSYEYLMDKMIYNSGTFAMKGYLFKQFISFFEKIVSQEQVIYDQLIFNHFIYSEYKQQVYEHRKLFMCGYKNIELGLMRKQDGIWVNDKNEIISICHFCGSTKKYI